MKVKHFSISLPTLYVVDAVSLKEREANDVASKLLRASSGLTDDVVPIFVLATLYVFKMPLYQFWMVRLSFLYVENTVTMSCR